MKRIVCYGDSNTYGYDPRDYGRYDENHRWTALLAQEPEFEVLNFGMNGRSLADADSGNEFFYKSMERVISERGKIDQIIIMLGTNNILNGDSAEECKEKLDALLQKAMHFASQILVIAPDAILIEGLFEEGKKYAQYCKELATKYSLGFFVANSCCEVAFFDKVHLDEMSHTRLAEELRKLCH